MIACLSCRSNSSPDNSKSGRRHHVGQHVPQRVFLERSVEARLDTGAP
jgi:hypothetical protein